MRKPVRLDCRAFHPRLEVWLLDEVGPDDGAAVRRFASCKAGGELTPEEMKDLDLDDSYGVAVKLDKEKAVVVIQVEKGLRGLRRTTTLSHEAIHAASFIMQHIGQPPSWDGDEVFARLHDHIFGQMLEAT